MATDVAVSFEYEGMQFNRAFSVDLLVEEKVVVELKSVERVANVHFKQLATYLKLMNLQVGILANFGCATMKEGLHRVVNGYKPEPTSASDGDSTRLG